MADAIQSGIERLTKWVSPKSPKTDEKQYIGFAGFKAFVAFSEVTTFNATVPDIVCEDLTTVTDTIVNKPKVFSITGSVADVFIETDQEKSLLTEINKKVNALSPYLPTRTQSQISKVSSIIDDVDNTIDNALNSAVDILDTFGLVKKSPNATNQEVFIDTMEAHFDSKTIMALETPNRIYRNTALTSFSVTQTNDGDTMDFTASFKEVRIVDIDLFRDNTKQTPSEEAKKSVNKTTGGQLDSVTDKGINQGVSVTDEKSDSLLGIFK